MTLHDGTSCNLLREVRTTSQTNESKRPNRSIQLSGASGFGLSRYQWRMSTQQGSLETTPPKSTSSRNSTMTPTRATPLRVRLRSSSSATTTPSPSSTRFNHINTKIKNKRRVAINTLTPIRTKAVDSK